MSTLGKVLIVLNLLAMGGVAYLASMDWAKRQEWAFAALSREIQLVGLPVESGTGGDKEYVSFPFRGESGTFTDLRRADLAKLLPSGAIDPWGTATPVASQEEEIKRLETVVFGLIDGAGNKRSALATLLLNLAETGEERDGVYALLNGISLPTRSLATRYELAYLAPGPSQQAGLTALVAVAEYQRGLRINKQADESVPQREAARNSLIRLAVADLPYTVATVKGSGTRQDRYKAQKELTDQRSKPDLLRLIESSQRANATDQELAAARDAVSGKGTDDNEKRQLLRIAQIAGNLLDSDVKINDALTQIAALVLERAESDPERKAVTELIPLVQGTVQDNALDSTAVTAGTSFLRMKFSDAQLPVAKTGPTGDLTGKPVQTESEKRTRIAHLLYHIDADRRWEERGAWHKRVAAVVGINTYTETADAQANRIAAAAQRVDQLILNEQNVFESQYASYVREAQYLSDQLATVEAQLVEQKRVVDEYQTDVNQRTGERDALLTNLATARNKAQTSLTAFREKQNDLIAATKKLRQAQDSISKLESDIRRLEGEIKK